jgi:hypothetical protein
MNQPIINSIKNRNMGKINASSDFTSDNYTDTEVDSNRKRSPLQPLHKPENVSVIMGHNKGSVFVSCDVIEHASLYEVKYAELIADCQLNWIYKVSMNNKILIEGLTEGKQYVFLMAAIESNLFLVWSDEIKVLVI